MSTIERKRENPYMDQLNKLTEKAVAGAGNVKELFAKAQELNKMGAKGKSEGAAAETPAAPQAPAGTPEPTSGAAALAQAGLAQAGGALPKV